MVSACSSSGSLTVRSARHDTTSASPTSASPRPSASIARTPTGDELGGWLTSLQLPKGWSRPQGVGGGETTSGPLIDTPYGPNHRESTCSAIGFGDQAGEVLHWWSLSSATLQIDYPSDPHFPDAELSVGIYKPGYAARTISYLAAIVRRCRSYPDRYLHNTPGNSSMTTIPHLGDQNILVTSSDHTSNAGTPTGRVLVVRVGNNLVASDDGTSNNIRAATIKGFADWLMGLWLKSKYA
jgi:hypothetical protein